MNAETLNFVKDGEWHEADFTSAGTSATVQLEQETPSDVCVLAGVPGLNLVPIGTIVNHHLKDLIFEVEVAEGMNVQLRTLSPIVNAKIVL